MPPCWRKPGFCAKAACARDKTRRMQDEQLQPAPPPLLPPSRRRTSLRSILLAGLIAFLLGAGAVGWLAWRGDLARLIDSREPAAPQRAAAPTPNPAAPAVTGQALDTAEARVALLEERLSRVDQQATAASGNAVRAEGLLIAFAARRAIDRGAPLGYIENQLRLRFADAQPNAVRTVVEAARRPLTIDELAGRLEAQSSLLAKAPAEDDAWTRVRREVSNLFVIRRDSTPSSDPQNRLLRARMLLAAGKVDGAIAEVERLPGANEARGWIGDARRYAEVQRALDLIETTAMLEPQRLKDDHGARVDQPSPLAPPAESAAPEATPSAPPAQNPAI